MEPQNQTNSSGAVLNPPPTAASGCLGSLGWFAAGWVLPCFSPTFYAHAARRRVASAIAFLFLVAFIATGLHTLGAIRGLVQAGAEIQQEFASGRFPEITITDGVAEVNGPQPFVLVDQTGMLVVFDTTGVYTGIDRSRYSQGILLTRTTIVVLNAQGQYQEIPLSDLQQAFDADPIDINGETVVSFWAGFSVIATIVVGVFLFLWYTVVRLAYLALIALVLWGVAALIRPGVGFGPVLITGIYALVPAIYLHFLLGQISVTFIFLFTLLFVPLWIAALALALMTRAAAPASDSVTDYFKSERPVREWRALLALPLLLDFALEVIFQWKAWYVTWPLAFLTFGALVLVSLWPLFSKPKAAVPSG
jgi:hypothetical protein